MIKELNPGGGGNNFDIADKITISDFRQKMMEEHKGEEIESKPEVKIKKAEAGEFGRGAKEALTNH